MVFFNIKRCKQIVLCAYFFAFYQAPAWASTTTSNLPFESTMSKLKDGITGTFLTSIAIIMVVITCFMLAFAEMGEGMRKFINVVLWLSVAFGASSFLSSMFSAGAVFS